MLALIALCIVNPQAKVLEGAKKQLVNPAVYDASYQRLSYPGGDVPLDRGACSDVIVRSLRHAGYDLQVLIQQDNRKAPYPRMARPDRNIDHRRVANQIVYFARHGLKLDHRKQNWKAGDFVTWKLPNNLDHIGILSDNKSSKGHPLVIHNISGCKEEDVLFTWRIVGHYRFPVRNR